MTRSGLGLFVMRRVDGSIAIGEVAARPPGAQFMTLMSWVCDTDMYRAFAQLMVFETFTPPVRRWSAGAAYLRGQMPQGRTDARVRAVTGLEEVRESLGDLEGVVEAPGARAGPRQGRAIHVDP